MTGSSGLIGSEVCAYFDALGWKIHGVDNNQRAVFFGPQGDNRWNQKRLEADLRAFCHHELDIRDRHGMFDLVKQLTPDAIIHTAAQPSHDKAAEIPFDDFETNAVGTLNILEAARQFCPKTTFIYLSTNKVYGDAPNRIPLKELDKKWEYDDVNYKNGITESFSIDQSKHSLFGASKVAADIMVQEYGRYFGIATCCLRGGCLTGPNHAGVELHGFLSYLVKCNMEGKLYTIFGYKGKQVRDNIHALDVVRFMEAFIENPRYGEVYNLGGGLNNACSILEAFEHVSKITEKKMTYQYVDKNREGDHICYISDLQKMRSHYPQWDISKSLNDIFIELVEGWRARLNT